jgi:hypothetical protein
VYICRYNKSGANYGVVLLPEGLVEFIPELRNLITEIDTLYNDANTANVSKEGTKHLESSYVKERLTLWSRAILDSLPDFMQSSLLLSRGSNNNVQLSQAQTERMLAHFVDVELSYRKARGSYKGTFSSICSFIGYQARGALPSVFDSNYAYNLGHACVHAVRAGLNGYVVTINNLKAPVGEWTVTAVPLVSLFEFDVISNKLTVPMTFVDVTGPAYKALEEMKKSCAVRVPGTCGINLSVLIAIFSVNCVRLWIDTRILDPFNFSALWKSRIRVLILCTAKPSATSQSLKSCGVDWTSLKMPAGFDLGCLWSFALILFYCAKAWLFSNIDWRCQQELVCTD